jgi:hypothetical protein
MLNFLKVEFIKIKASLLMIIVVITAAPLYYGISVSNKLRDIESNPNTLETIYDFSIIPYTFIILPAIIIIIFAIFMRLERTNGGLKEILSLPVTKKQLFFSKLIIGILHVGISLLSFYVILIASSMTHEDFTIEGAMIVLVRIIKIFIVSLSTISIQFYLSLNYDNIGVPLGLGFCLLIPSFLLSSSDYAVLYPWSYVTAVNNTDGLNLNSIIMLTVSIAIFILVSIAGYKKFNNTDIR